MAGKPTTPASSWCPPVICSPWGITGDNSLDSRFGTGGPPFLQGEQGVGYLAVDDLVGKAEFIFFSIDATSPWWQFWEWPFEIRWNRLLTGIR